MNHWFYLLAEGSNPGNGKPNSPTCNSSTLTGIGHQQAGKIFYNAMLTKTSGMTYPRWRVNTLTAAKNLDPTCAQHAKVKAAWDAVSLGAQSGEPTCTGGGAGGVANGGFETGSLSGWTTSGTTSLVTSGAHGGASAARAGSTSPTNGDRAGHRRPWLHADAGQPRRQLPVGPGQHPVRRRRARLTSSRFADLLELGPVTRHA